MRYTPMSLEYCVETMENFFSNQQIKYIVGRRGTTPVTQGDLEIALANIDQHFDFIGIVERYRESILLLSRVLGWKPCLFAHLNARRIAEPVSAETRSKLSKMNVFDQILYDRVRGRFETITDNEGSEFDAAICELTEMLDSRAANHDGEVTKAELVVGELPAVARYIRGDHQSSLVQNGAPNFFSAFQSPARTSWDEGTTSATSM